MAALTQEKVREYAASYLVALNDELIAASSKVFSGGAVGFDAGLVKPLSADSFAFAGFAETNADNASGAAAAQRVPVRSQGLVKLDVAGVDGVDDVGKKVYATTDNDFTLVSTGAALVGKIRSHVSGTTCWVFFQASNLNLL